MRLKWCNSNDSNDKKQFNTKQFNTLERNFFKLSIFLKMATNPQQSGDQNKDTLNLGLDLDSILGDVLSNEKQAASVFSTSDEGLLRIDGDKIVLEIDEELEQGIDEEAKMFQANEFYKKKDWFNALIVALALNIRFKQGVGKRSDAIVRRQDEILFECNYQIAAEHLQKIKETKGDEQLENKLAAIMHFYTALDQKPLKGQEQYRDKAKQVIDSMVTRDRAGGQAYIKAGFFKKIEVPSIEDKAQKAFYWKDRAANEKDAVRKEFYLLMTFASDIGYFPYQLALANFYLESGRLDEACRYIKVALPLVKDEGVDFLSAVRKKDSAYSDKFIERRLKSDVRQLRTRLEQPSAKEASEKDEARKAQMAKQRIRKFLETVDLWEKQMETMKTDVPFKDTTLRIAYMNALVDLMEEVTKRMPGVIVQDYIDRYKATEVRSTQNPNILNFIDFSFKNVILPDEKTVQGLVVEGDAETKLDKLMKTVVEYFNVEIGILNKPLSEVKANVARDVDELVKAMKAQGYKFKSMPVLTK